MPDETVIRRGTLAGVPHRVVGGARHPVMRLAVTR